MIGKQVRITKGKHYGETGEVMDKTNFPNINEPAFLVYFGSDSTALCCADEMEVI